MLLLLKLLYITVALGLAIPRNDSPTTNKIIRPANPYPFGFPTAPDNCDHLSQNPSEDCLRISKNGGTFYYDKSCTDDKRTKMNTAFYDAFTLANHAKGWPNIKHGSQTTNYYMGPDYIHPIYQRHIADNIQQAADFLTAESNDSITILCNNPKNYCQRKLQDPNNLEKDMSMKIGGYAWTYLGLWWYYHNINMCNIFYDIPTISDHLDQGPEHANNLVWFQTSGSYILHEMMHTRLINHVDPHIGDESLDPDGAPGDRRAYMPKWVHKLAEMRADSPNKGGAQRSSINADSYAQLFSALYWWATWDRFPGASGEAFSDNTVNNSLNPGPPDEADDYPVMICVGIVNGLSNCDALFGAVASGYGPETVPTNLLMATATQQLPMRQATCHGIGEDQWIVNRDIAVQSAAIFCKKEVQTSPILSSITISLCAPCINVTAYLNTRCNKGSPNDLRLFLTNTVDPSLPILEAPDCLNKFVLLLDSCDGNDSINNSHNYKFGGNHTSPDGWLYRITPLAKQLKADDCEVSYRFWYDEFEIRGENFPDALLGKDGMGLLSQLRGCGIVTEWYFETTPKDPTYQWYAHGHLPIGTKLCVERATISAGGITVGDCQGAE